MGIQTCQYAEDITLGAIVSILSIEAWGFRPVHAAPQEQQGQVSILSIEAWGFRRALYKYPGLVASSVSILSIEAWGFRHFPRDPRRPDAPCVSILSIEAWGFRHGLCSWCRKGHPEFQSSSRSTPVGGNRGMGIQTRISPVISWWNVCRFNPLREAPPQGAIEAWGFRREFVDAKVNNMLGFNPLNRGMGIQTEATPMPPGFEPNWFQSSSRSTPVGGNRGMGIQTHDAS